MKPEKVIVISVWNCQARVHAYEEYDEGRYACEDITEKLPPSALKLAEDAVYRQGGALNLSGLYYATPKLLRLCEKVLGVKCVPNFR